jgi:hypothetical protein
VNTVMLENSWVTERLAASQGFASAGLDGSGSISVRNKDIYIRCRGFAYPMGTEGVSAEREAGHSPLSSAEVKNAAVIPPLPHTSSWRWSMIKHREN